MRKRVRQTQIGLVIMRDCYAICKSCGQCMLAACVLLLTSAMPQQFQVAQQSPLLAGTLHPAAGDFNGDGKPDIVATFQGDFDNAPNVTVLLNQTVPYGAKTQTKRRLGAGRR